MSAESERVFSGTRRTILWFRSQLSTRMVEALECLKHWQITGVVSENFVLRDSEAEDLEELAEEDLYT